MEGNRSWDFQNHWNKGKVRIMEIRIKGCFLEGFDQKF